MARFSIFLITLALIIGMVGCGPVKYNLTISSTEGGEVTIPGEGTFTYDEGTVVNLTAEADEGYQFFNWTGNVSAIADVNAATITITMNDDYTVTANFALLIPIWDWYDLDAIRDNPGGSYLLMNDLDSTTTGYINQASPTANEGKGWDPIGTRYDWFEGIFDGHGFEIRDLFIHREDEYDVGLFGYFSSGVIKDVGTVNATVTGLHYVGGLVGINHGTVNNSYSAGNVQGFGNIGGLVGVNYGNVANSSSTASVTSTSSPYGFPAGGLVGWNRGTISNSYSTGSVTGDSDIGGLVGDNGGTVNNSYATGNVTGDDSFIGGLVGANYFGTVSNSYATGRVTGSEDVGGLVGKKYGSATVVNSFWDTETSGQVTSAGGTGKTTAEMQDIATFSGRFWDIIGVANPSIRNSSYIWNMVDDQTYPFLSWEPVS